MGIASKVVQGRVRNASNLLLGTSPPSGLFAPWLNLPLELRGSCAALAPFGRTLVLYYPGALLLLLPSVLQRGSDR